jgi:hypothetical protein
MIARCFLGTLLTILAPAMAQSAPQAEHVAVPNPSFERPSASQNVPGGWEFQGPGAAPDGAWTLDSPYDGQHALRIDARRGPQRWQSAAIELPAHREFLLSWRTRFHGEKTWRFRAAFCGAEVVCRDERGQPIHTARAHSSCWQTVGWQPGWLRVSVPEEAKSLVVRFAVETDEALPGGFDVDSVELLHWPLKSTDASRPCLTLRIHDEHDRPTAARVRVVSSQGVPVDVLGGIQYRTGGAVHPLDEGECRLLVPPDSYTITVTKGLEYRPWQKTVRLEAGDSSVDVKLERAWDWPARGWYCGDHHTHLHRHGGSVYPTLTWRDAMRAARSEGLDYLPFMGADQYPTDMHAAASELEQSDFVAELTDEITEDLWGHVCPIGALPEQRNEPRYDAGPMNFDRDAAISPNGVLCYAHPYHALDDDELLTGVSDPRRGHVAREFPIDLALGMRCGIDLLTMEGDRNELERKLRDVYRLYNLGFRPAITASTDFHIDQARQPIGAVRTYVRSGELEMPAIAAAYRAGRTFATNGPLIDLEVENAAPGDEIALSDTGQSLLVKVEAVSIGQLERVEIVVNGQTVHTLTAAEPHRIAGQFSLPARESMWVAAKAIGPKDPHLAAELEGRKLGAGQFAHTSPVYVLVEGRPILAARKDDAHYFAHWCDAALGAWQAHVLEHPLAARDDQLIRQRINRAKSVFLELAARL